MKEERLSLSCLFRARGAQTKHSLFYQRRRGTRRERFCKALCLSNALAETTRKVEEEEEEEDADGDEATMKIFPCRLREALIQIIALFRRKKSAAVEDDKRRKLGA